MEKGVYKSGKLEVMGLISITFSQQGNKIP